jgi:hypothetical protein
MAISLDHIRFGLHFTLVTTFLARITFYVGKVGLCIFSLPLPF